MLALTGIAIILSFIVLIATKKVSVMTALVFIPLLGALLYGFSITEIGTFAYKGLLQVSPTAVLLMFAVFYFSIMLDSGLFDPLIQKIINFAKGDPQWIVIGTAVLTMIIHLDGDGTATFMIVISALLPIYKALNINRLILSGIIALGVGPIHLVPWSGTTARALTTFEATSSEILIPNLPSIFTGIVWVLVVAWYWGKKEKKRLGVSNLNYQYVEHLNENEKDLRRPQYRLFNLILTLCLLTCLILNILPHSVLFILGSLLALQINYRKALDQRKLISRHGNSIFLVVSIIFAAGVFSGILTQSGMINAMASSLVENLPKDNAKYLVVFSAIFSMPASLIFTPDAYYFGVLPVLKEYAIQLNTEPLQYARAALLGQMTVGFPLSPLTASTFLLINLAEVELIDHQKHTFFWAWGTTILMTITAIITGSIFI